jgi:hypothetical protein
MAIATLFAFGLASGCGSNSTATSPSAVAPAVTALTPPPVVAASQIQLETVQGKNFLAGLTATLTDPNGGQQTFANSDIQTLQTTSFQIAATFPVSGAYKISVSNPGGVMSDPLTFQVATTVVGSSPHINSVTPSSATHGPDTVSAEIDGTNFSATSTVTLVDPTGQSTTLLPSLASSESVRVAIVLARVGTYSISVTNPDGQVSNSVSIAVF